MKWFTNKVCVRHIGMILMFMVNMIWFLVFRVFVCIFWSLLRVLVGGVHGPFKIDTKLIRKKRLTIPL